MHDTPARQAYIHHYLSALYEDPSTGYRGRDPLYAAARERGFNISRRDVAWWLGHSETNQLHLIRPRDTTSRHIKSSGLHKLWQVDLLDVQNISPPQNGQTRYLLNVVDVYSRYQWAYGLPNKRPPTVMAAIAPLIAQYNPSVIQTDRGAEFARFAELGPKHLQTPPYSPNINGVAERAGATLKRLIFRYMTQQGRRVYMPALPQLLDNRNSAPHEGIGGLRPTDVLRGAAHPQQPVNTKMRGWQRPRVGGKVRIRKMALDAEWRRLALVKKHYLPTWSRETYTVASKHDRGLNDVWYSIVELPGERFQLQDLQPVVEDELVRVQRPVPNWAEADQIDDRFSPAAARPARQRRAPQRDEAEGYQREVTPMRARPPPRAPVTPPTPPGRRGRAIRRPARYRDD